MKNKNLFIVLDTKLSGVNKIKKKKFKQPTHDPLAYHEMIA